ncbi:hypothetical protein [Streptomyces sp. WELS2]|nr:hypothetical protein [Streptomyces sp. WELS2]
MDAAVGARALEDARFDEREAFRHGDLAADELQALRELGTLE